MANGISSSDLVSTGNNSHSSEKTQISSTVNGKTWSAENPKCCVKYSAIGLVATLIIASLVGIGVSGGFGPTGWLQHTAIPAIRKFLDTIPDLNVWQGFAYIAAPILGAGIISGITYKYIVPGCKQLHADHQKKKAEEEPVAPPESQQEFKVEK